ncbi:sensor histidine kinase, partial [Butyricicoccus sp.]|uniref:sensor histidine kinase n=1 Tax=Butyricicoccus sp. TaxID=2049021 RepID=UPI003F148D19
PISIVFSSAIILIFSTYLSRRITTLKEAMHQARLGDYNIIDSMRGTDELQDTFQDLKATVEMIRENESRYYAEQLARQQLINRQQQMEFKMLASQINPHFLYNTLETIRMQALANGNRDVATSIKLLGKSMHYVLENTGTDFTTLSKELDYIRTYLTIQQIRFGDRVNFSIQIQDNLDPEQYHILPLLLQPIVENSIVHGLENMGENGRIIISASADSSFLILTVQDNGCGMSPDELNRLTEHMQDAEGFHGTSIGLYNIFQRIRLCYGENGDMVIESKPQQGTRITLRLPHTAVVR